MRWLLVLVLWPVVGAASGPAQAADLRKIDRSVGKEPKYRAAPRYALVVLGLDAKRSIWFVQDGDLLYVDKNGNRDLTDEGERIQGKRDRIGRGGVERQRTLFLVDGITGANRETLGFVYEYYLDRTLDDFFDLYADFRPQAYPRYGTCLQGLPGDSQGDFRFAEKREDCPIFHFQGPLTLRRIGKEAFVRGATASEDAEENLSVRIGTPGVGQGSLAAVETDRVPKDVHPKAEIVFPGRTASEAPIKLTVALTKRC